MKVLTSAIVSLIILLSVFVVFLFLLTSNKKQRNKFNNKQATKFEKEYKPAKKINNIATQDKEKEEKVYDEFKDLLNESSKPQPNLIEQLDKVFKALNNEHEYNEEIEGYYLEELNDIIENQKYTAEEEEIIAKYLLDALINSPEIWDPYSARLRFILEVFTKIRYPEAFEVLKKVFFKFSSQDLGFYYKYLLDALTFQDHSKAEKFFVSLIDQIVDREIYHDLSEQLKKIARMGELDTSTIQFLLSKINKELRAEDFTPSNILCWSSVVASSKDSLSIKELEKAFFEEGLTFWQKYPIARAFIENIPEKFVPQIEAYYYNNSHDINTREAILACLSSFPKKYIGHPIWNTCRQMIINGLTDPEASIRSQAVLVSYSDVFVDEIFISYLTNLLNDPSPNVAESAKKAIEIISRKTQTTQSPK